ncbi:hypothetical protein [Lederbergia lenta]|uniref:Uncharacterized protein n=1 Tax=Lederbergia lenta TaxID=1467 RepID=A0A2X4W7N1_LEDLE|nr:hypothetical protein [Lederbergia lenta]MCM3109587.1 hypothetical protein [Lederbergia lenta]MEC2324658.1 hypothetical protein [Lederbergia lenta]SQI58739.1 Uncharacterised protein [Lederbergia lenta]
MLKVIDFTKNLFADVFVSIRGFMYGFLVVSLGIGVIGVILYLFLTIRNLFL